MQAVGILTTAFGAIIVTGLLAAATHDAIAALIDHLRRRGAR